MFLHNHKKTLNILLFKCYVCNYLSESPQSLHLIQNAVATVLINLKENLKCSYSHVKHLKFKVHCLLENLISIFSQQSTLLSDCKCSGSSQSFLKVK